MATVITIVVIVALVLLVAGFFWLTYNGLVSARLRVREAWSGIDVQLKRRASLVPNLVETVKGYAGHEREVLESVTRARAELVQAGSPEQAARADNALTGALRSLFAVAEAYPELQADENFLDLQRQLAESEDRIAYARQYYNANVTTYNTKIESFPSLFVARMFGFNGSEFYEAEDAAREEVQVSFA